MKENFIKRLSAGLTVIVTTGLLLISCQAAPIALPSWAKPIESQLPKISPEIISEVDDLYSYWLEGDDRVRVRELKEQFNPTAWRMVELREQAGKAMIWQFLRESNRHETRIRYLLEELKGDQDLAALFLPVIRCRMNWLKQLIQDGGITEYSRHYDFNTEFHAIKRYIYSQGEPSDLVALNQLIAEDVKQGKQTFSDLETPEQQAQAVQKAQEATRKQNEPYWHKYANYLIEQGLLTKEALLSGKTAPNPDEESDPPKSVAVSKTPPETTATNHFPQPWMVWMLIGAVLVSLLRVLLRKPK